MRSEKIYFANGVKMKLIKDAEGNVTTEVMEPKKVQPKVEPVLAPKVEVNEEPVQATEVPEGDAGEGSATDEQRDPRRGRRVQGKN